MTHDLQDHTRHDIADRSLDPVTPIASQSLFWRARYLAASPSLGALPLLFWLSETIRPAIGVTLGIGDAVPHFALCQAVEKLGLDAMCFGVRTADDLAGDPNAIEDYNAAHYGEFSLLLGDDEARAPELLEGAKIDFLVVNRPATKALQDEIDRLWLPQLSDRAVVLFLRGGDDLRDYAAGIARGAGQFSLDARGGICLALHGDQHGDRLTRLCQLRVGRPGYLAVRNVFTRMGELHEKTCALDTGEPGGAEAARIAALEAKLSERDAHVRQLTERLEDRTAEPESTRATLTAPQETEENAADIPSSSTAEIPAPAPQGPDAESEDSDALRAQLHAREEELEARLEDIAILGNELKKLSTELEDTRKRAAGHMRSLEDATHGAQDKGHDLATLRDILHETERDRDEARQRVADLESSSSWRITSPLRRASLMVRRGRDGA